MVLICRERDGYGAIGFTRKGYTSAAFMNIPWGTVAVFEKTLESLASEGVRTGILSPWSDVDSPVDLDALRERLKRSGHVMECSSSSREGLERTTLRNWSICAV